MNGWMIAKPYEVSGGLPTLVALFAVWEPDREAALRAAQDLGPRGSGVRPSAVAPLSENMLRGLRLNPGESGRLHAERPWI